MKIYSLVKVILYLGISLFLFSCEDNRRSSRSSGVTDIQLDHNQCVSNGFEISTFEYKECREKLEEQRRY